MIPGHYGIDIEHNDREYELRFSLHVSKDWEGCHTVGQWVTSIELYDLKIKRGKRDITWFVGDKTYQEFVEIALNTMEPR